MLSDIDFGWCCVSIFSEHSGVCSKVAAVAAVLSAGVAAILQLLFPNLSPRPPAFFCGHLNHWLLSHATVDHYTVMKCNLGLGVYILKNPVLVPSEQGRRH